MQDIATRLGFAAMVVLVVVSSVDAVPSMPTQAQLEEESSLRVAWETPHTKWASPSALGTIRALFLVHLHTNRNLGPSHRIVELMRRFEIDGDVVLVASKKGTGDGVAYAGGLRGHLGEARLDQLLQQR